MSETSTLPWLVIRQDEDGGRYRVGRCATRVEAQRLAERLRAPRSGVRPDDTGPGGPSETGAAGAPEAGPTRYLVERLEQPSGGAA
ncbi:SPOR domain-containing protein [Streptomyces chumphonensis]|uniref:SPOR domain-containing protein n=1 Tax=Streptomyces chumphonensis TaxID=1214925 RepID=UPI00363146D5